MTKNVEIFENNIKEDGVITFDDGLLGFEEFKKYVLLSPEVDLPFKYLQYVDDESLALVVINPFLYFQDYSFDIEDDTIKELDAQDTSHILVLAVAVIPQDITKMTANFAAPILINVNNMKGKQIVLADAKYEIRFPIYDLYKDIISKGAK